MNARDLAFTERLQVIQAMFTSQPVTISRNNNPPVNTTCLRLVHTENENVDFICANETRYGMRLSATAVITTESVTDKVSALNQFFRTVKLRKSPTAPRIATIA